MVSGVQLTTKGKLTPGSDSFNYEDCRRVGCWVCRTSAENLQMLPVGVGTLIVKVPIEFKIYFSLSLKLVSRRLRCYVRILILAFK